MRQEPAPEPAGEQGTEAGGVQQNLLLGGARLLVTLGVRTGVKQVDGPSALPLAQHFSNAR